MFGARFTDGAGDLVTTMSVQGPVERIEVVVEGTVETTDTAGVLRGHRETISPRVYLQPTARDPAEPAADRARAARRSAAPRRRRSTGRTGCRRRSPTRSPTSRAPPTPATTAAEALELGRGVCQDMAHALIALAHCAGLPARYVTGYLLTGEEPTPARRRTPGPRSTSTASAGSASTRRTAAAPTSATSGSARGATRARRRRSAASRAAAASRRWTSRRRRRPQQ